jgi:DNA recombination protein RmuC
MVIVALLIGLAAGALAVLLAVRPALVERRRRIQEVIELERSLAAAEAELRVERESSDARLEAAMKALSSEALDANSSRFLELAETHLTGHVKPLKESLERMDRQLQTVERARQESYGALTTQVSTLAERAGSLTNALRTPHVRGRWGEAQLRNVVELAGMVEHCDYVSQATTPTDDGTLRPDLVVRIPGGKHVVVDAKAPLDAYLKALEAPDEAARQALLADHARQVRTHLTQLSAKDYAAHVPSSPEFVVMFLPGEMFFSAALEQDPSLIEFGVDLRVIPASPTTLIALLRAVAYGWQQEAMEDNARKISELGRGLYDAVRVLGGHFDTLGTRLKSSLEAFNQAVGSLEGNVLVKARRFKELQATNGVEEIKVLEPIDRVPRMLQARELTDGLPFADAVELESEPEAERV